MSGPGRPCPQNEQAVAWALHALEPDEEVAMRTHLPHCPSCRATVREAEYILGGIAAAPTERVDPPARLRENLLARVADTPQEPTPATAPRAGTDDRRRDATAARSRSAGRAPRRSSAGRRLLLVAAVVAAVLGIGGVTAYGTQMEAQRDSQTAQADTLAGIVTQLDHPGTRHATLSTLQGEPVAAVLVAGGRRTVVTAGVSPNEHDSTIYVLWGMSAEGPRPVATFDVAETGTRVHPVRLVTDDEPYAGYAISLEPGRTAPAAPTTIVASGPVET